MKILITGSSGNVGRIVAARLSRQHEVIGVDRVPGPHTNVVCDIRDMRAMRDRGTIKSFMNGAGVDINVIIHLAALHAPHVGLAADADFKSINVDATAALMDLAREAGIARFLFASTTSIYGNAMKNKPHAVWVTESLMPEPGDIYDETKLAAEALCAAAFAPSFITASLRIARCFPEPARDLALYRLYRGVDLRDVADAFELALTAPLTQFDAFNISGQSPFQQSDCESLMRDARNVLMQRVANIEADFAMRGWALPLQFDRVYVIDKAKQQLGYAPRFGYRELMDSFSAKQSL